MSALKKLLADPVRAKVLKGAACVLAGLCLTAYVDNLYPLNFIWLRLAAFGCALAVCGTLLYFAGRIFKSAPAPWVALLSAAAAILILAGCRTAFFPPQRETYITLVAKTAGEICLCDVVVDGENIPVAQAEVVENSGWLYREEYDNFMIWPEEDGAANRLTMRFAAQQVRLGFPYTPYAGSVSIESSAGSGGTWDLRCPEWGEGEAVEYADIPVDCRRAYSPLELLVYGAGLLPVLGAACLILFHATGLAWQRSRLRAELLLFLEDKGLRGAPASSLLLRSGRRLALPAGLAAAYYLLFFTSPKIGPDGVTAGFLALLTAGAWLCLPSGLGRRLLEKYRTRGKTALVAAIALYASLASFGQRFFLDGNTRMHFSPEGAFYVALGTVWFIPVIYLLLLGLEWLASLRRPGNGPAYRRLAFWGLLAVLCACQAVVLWNFWPGGFATDSIDLMIQAVAHDTIWDWHPAINAILFRVVLDICPHAGALVAVQLFFFALLCTEFLMLGYDRGLPFQALAVLGAGFGLLPNLVVFGITPLKDYPYTLALLWGTYLLVRLALNLEELRRWRFLGALALSLFLIYAFRHNGVVPFAAVLLLFAWITLRHFPQVKLRLAAVCLCGVLLAAVYKGPVFSLFRVSRDVMMSPYTTMLCAAASCANKGLALSAGSTAVMESVLPLDQWADYYDRYMGHDPYYWGRGELSDEYPFDPTHITAGQAFSVYLEALCKYPDVVVKDRLDGTDLLWDVRQPPDSFNTKGFCDVVLWEENQIAEYFDFGPMEPGVPYYNHSRLSELYRGTMSTEANSVFDMLLWRSGAYLILLMALGVFWWGNRMKRFFWAAAPLLGQIAGLALVLYHQSYRYISAVQVLTLALAFCSVFLRGGEDGGGRRQAVPAGAGAEPPAAEPPGEDAAEPPAGGAAKPPAGRDAAYAAEALPGAGGGARVEGRGMDKIAVLIPCYNEGRTIGKVVAAFRRELPEAVIYVYDNNSTDGTGEIARRAGAVVRRERRQGKGNVIRRMFREINAECYLMVDGDDTYPAENAREMADAVLLRQADMVVGDRLSSTYFQENKRPFHNFGNSLVRGCVNLLFHSDIRDIMTGYRAFSYQFVKSFPVLSRGFELETEMSIHAVDKNMRIENVVVPYRDRQEGSASKLNTFSDGAKVLRTICRLFRIYKPYAFFCTCAAVLMALALAFFVPVLLLYMQTGQVPKLPTLIVCGFTAIGAIQSFFAGMILETINQKNRQDFELELIRLNNRYQGLAQTAGRPFAGAPQPGGRGEGPSPGRWDSL